MKYLIILLILLIVYLFYSLSNHEISSDKAKKMIREGKIDYIIDVRTLEEWNEGHHPEAVHLPMGRFPENINKNSRLLIYCRTGRRAKIAVQQYIKKGYKNVNYITGNYKSLL